MTEPPSEGDWPSAAGDLVFIGGTGRSGTHVLARLLDRHPRFAGVPIESRFHCNKRGMPDLLGGRVTLAAFVEKLRDFWWHRVRVDGQPRGLYNLLTRAAVRRRVGALRARLPRPTRWERAGGCSRSCCGRWPPRRASRDWSR